MLERRGQTSMGFLRHFSPPSSGRIARALGLAALLVLPAVEAGTIVRFSTTYGDFSVETLDEAAPATVQNFLNYVNDGDYAGTFLHRLERGFALQGGAYRFQPFVGLIPVPQDPPVINEFNVSNTRGTLAMAKLPEDPNSATSQWFVNLGDNAANLDVQNGGFTVFAQVLGDGMNTVDAIAANSVFNLGRLTPELPLRSDTTSPNTNAASVKADNFIVINPVVTQRYSAALHVFESVTGRLITSVDGGTEGKFSLNLSLVAWEPEIIFELNAESLVPLAVAPEGMSTWSSADNRLRIPTLEINDNGNVFQITNAVLVLSDPALQRFTLESYQQ